MRVLQTRLCIYILHIIIQRCICLHYAIHCEQVYKYIPRDTPCGSRVVQRTNWSRCRAYLGSCIIGICTVLVYLLSVVNWCTGVLAEKPRTPLHSIFIIIIKVHSVLIAFCTFFLDVLLTILRWVQCTYSTSHIKRQDKEYMFINAMSILRLSCHL